MKLSLRTIATLPCLAALLAIAGTAHAASIVNGLFSSPITTGWSQTGSGTTPGNHITIITLGTANDTGFGDTVPLDGSITNAAYFVDDNAHTENLSQTLSLAANTTYTVTFDLFGVASGDTNKFDDSLTASIGGVSKGFFDFTTQSWTGESLVFTTGAAGNYDLTFAFDAGPTPAKDIALTNVAITSPVPEPTSLALFGTGILGLAGVAKRKFLARS
jgi:PEP-CTERM motif-containing protein